MVDKVKVEIWGIKNRVIRKIPYPKTKEVQNRFCLYSLTYFYDDLRSFLIPSFPMWSNLVQLLTVLTQPISIDSFLFLPFAFIVQPPFPYSKDGSYAALQNFNSFLWNSVFNITIIYFTDFFVGIRLLHFQCRRIPCWSWRRTQTVPPKCRNTVTSIPCNSPAARSTSTQ
jgi:hypothetical protein